MRGSAVVATLLGCLLALARGGDAAGVSIACDTEKVTTYANGTVEAPCEIEFSLGFGISRSVDFSIMYTECQKTFRVFGDVGGRHLDYTVSEEDNAIEIPARVPGGCKNLYFNDITTSEDGVSFCPSLGSKCPISDPACVTIAAKDRCVGKATCGDCLADATCGWCYSKSLCLPRSGTNPQTDRCEVCEDFATDKCDACVEGCSGHGACADHACMCEPGWHGATCDIYETPTGGVVCNTVVTAVDLSLDMVREAGVGAHSDAFVVEDERVVYMMVALHPDSKRPAPADGPLYIRYGGEADLAHADAGGGGTHDLRVPFDRSELAPADAPCLTPLAANTQTAAASYLAVIEAPAMARGQETWFTTAAEGVRLRVTVVTCKRGFGGAHCTTPVTAFDPYEIDGRGSAGSKVTREENPDASSRYKVRVGLAKGAAHIVRFAVGVDTTRLSAYVRDAAGLAGGVGMRIYYEGREVHGVDSWGVVDMPMPSADWEVVLSWTDAAPGAADPSDAGPSEGEFELYLDFQRCEVGYNHDCGRDAVAFTKAGDGGAGSKEVAQDVPWGPESPWVHTRLAVKQGTRLVHVAATSSLPSLELYASYRIPARRREDAAARAQLGHIQLTTTGETLAITRPPPGFWYISAYTAEHIFDDTTLTVTAELSRCATCGADACVLNDAVAPIAAQRCRQDQNGGGTLTCERGGMFHAQYKCADAEDTAAGGTGSAAGMTSSSAGQSPFAKILFGLFVAAAGAGLFAVGTYAVAKWRVGVDARRRAAGGYDPGPVPTLDDDDFTVEVESEDETARPQDGEEGLI